MFLSKQIEVCLANDLGLTRERPLPHRTTAAQESRLAIFEINEVLRLFEKGLKKVFIMAPNYQAGKDALAGFKHYFKGDVVDEVYVPLNQLDYSAELARIAAATPDAIFVNCSGGGLTAGIALALAKRAPGAAVYACEPAACDLRVEIRKAS